MRNPLTVTVITDTHYYSKKLGTSGEAYEIANNKSGVLLAQAAEMLEAAFAQIAKDDRTDIVLLSGDTTSNGDLDSHNEFIEMLREGSFWNLYNLMNEHKYDDLWRQFDAYLSSYTQYEASISHSKILSLAERSMKDANQYRFYEFFRKWNPTNLRDDDWKEERNENCIG